MPFPEVIVPTTETVAKDLPSPPRDEFFLPENPDSTFLGILVVFATLTAAYIAADVILPILLALVLKLLLQPVMRVMSQLRIPRVISATLLIIAAFSVIIALGVVVAKPAEDWIRAAPERLPQIQERIKFISDPVSKVLSFLHPPDLSKPPTSQLNSEVQNMGLAQALFRGTQHAASELFETVLVLFFLLISEDLFLRRLVEIMPRFKDKRQVVDLSQQIENNVSAYLATITFMNATVGVATAIIMWLCGVSNPVLWGVIAFLLNFVPIMGPFFGIAIFLFQGLLVMPSLWRAVLPAALYFIVHLIEGETVTPMLLARRFTLNPVLVVISLIFWFWMWGVPGAILSVPMLAIAKIICDGIKPLNALGHFLEGE
jgi:predicted PurR-regulated permease PerM